MFESVASGDEPKHEMPTMGFLDHLEELRTRLVRSIIAVAVGFGVCWWKVDKIYEIMQRPIMKALKDNGMSEKLVYLNPTEPFNLYLKIAALAGLFLTSPFVLYQVWMFISPGLYRNEKSMSFPSWSQPFFSFPPEDISASKSSIPRRWASSSTSAASSSL